MFERRFLAEDDCSSVDSALKQSFLNGDQIKELTSNLIKPLNFANSTKKLVKALAAENNSNHPVDGDVQGGNPVPD